MRKIITLALLFGFVSTALFAQATPEIDKQTPIVPSEPIKLFNGHDLGDFYTYMTDTKYEDPRKIFTVKDGILIISGDGLGGLYSKKRYADYHMICEFKWGEGTYGGRKKATKDSGILVHGHGPDNGYGGRVWFSSIEAQLIQGGCGDFIVVPGIDFDKKSIKLSGDAYVKKDRDGEAIWDPAGKLQKFQGGRINNCFRDPDWKDVIDFRGENDVENPDGEWNTMEVICRGDQIVIKLNGFVVNRMFNCSANAGRILIQTEWAEIHVRRWELLPLGE
jgi:3-keto-disaccharide hydrolase